MKPFAEKFYKSARWVKCRNAYLKYKCGICERCGMVGEIVHHRIYLTPNNIWDASISMNFKNLELVCEKCHSREHLKKDICSRYYFDERGNIIIREKQNE